MQDNEKKPALRFKGFTDPWEQRKISELAEKTYGGGTPTTSNEAFWNGNIPWIQSSDIVDGKLMGVEPRKYITQTGLNSSATQLVPKDSIAIITRVGVGKLAYMPFSYSTSQDFLSLSKLNTEPFFTVYACYKKLQSELNTVQGTSIKGITKDELLAKTISVPVYSEQKQIGSFFTQLDTLITLHQRKYEKLVNIKKSMLDKMFPKNGASVPEIRFKGFTDPWEQRKLGDITVELSEYATQELGLPLLTSSRSGLMYQDEYRDSRTTKSTETLFSVVPVGTCTYRHMSDDDVFHMNINTLEKGLVSREYPVFEASKGNNLEFLVQHINSSEEFKAFCAEQKKGGTRTRLYYNTLCQFTVRVPALKEQAQISQCLKKLDTLITLHQRKLEKLQNIKKSCLEKMFV